MVRRQVGVAALLLALVAGGCAGPQAAAPATESGAPAGRASSGPVSRASSPDEALAPEHATTSLPTITLARLPEQARTTLRLINSGGPYPYAKDGAVFGNFEALLPRQPSGFYHEYTVVTPGSPDRGARRIVAGENGSRFFTADHYDSFREVVRK